MIRAPLLYDGLWHCLCPAIEPAALRATIARSPTFLRPVQRPAIPRHAATRRTSLQCNRRYGTAAADVAAEELIGIEQTVLKDDNGLDASPAPKQNGNRPPNLQLLSGFAPSNGFLYKRSVKDIIDALMILRYPDAASSRLRIAKPQHRALLLVRHLLRRRNYQLDTFIYETTMDMMKYHEGSATAIRKILRDVLDQGLKPTEAMCRSALAALVVHPDYVLRRHVLDTMEEFWYPVDVSTRQSVVLGMLRDQQYELAYLRLTEMIKAGEPVELWVYDIFIAVFGGVGFLDEMLSLLRIRKDADEEHTMVPLLLAYTLDVCSQAFHHAGTMYNWLTVVKTAKVQPTDGVLENVLGTAARHGDTRLATEALEMLSNRARIRDYHYEATAEAFAQSGDVPGALQILGIMKQNGYEVERENTTMLRQTLKGKPDLIDAAEKALRSLYRENRIPLAAASAVIEAKAEAHGSEQTMDLYRSVPLLCGELATPPMIHALIMHNANPNTQIELIRDYMATAWQTDETPQSALAYDVLIHAFMAADELDVAFHLANLAAGLASASRGGQPPAWIKPLVNSAVQREDGRILKLMDRFGEIGDEETVRVMGWMLKLARAKQPGAASS